MKKTIITISVIILAMLAMGTVAQARFGGGMGKHRGGPGLMMFADDLKLSDDQIQKIRDVETDVEKQVVKLQAECRVAQIEMKDLWEKGIPSESAVNKQIDKISNLRTQIKKAKAAGRISAMKVLSADQLDQFKKLRMKRGACCDGERMKDRDMQRMHRQDRDCPMFRPE